MKIVLNIDDKNKGGIEEAARNEGMEAEEWLSKTISDYVSSGGSTTSTAESDGILEEKEKEIERLKEEIKLQIELKEAYGKLLDEKNSRIDDLKEEIVRIEVMSVTAADQINQDKDDRIKDLNKMIEHLQGQAAAHSLALQSAIKSHEDEEDDEESDRDKKKKGKKDKNFIEKPRWMFWK